MNHWQDDPVRSHSHRRGAARRLKNSIRMLLLVSGGVLLVLALALGGLSLTKDDRVQRKLLNLGGGYAAAGAALLAAHFLAFTFPAWRRERRSEAWQRRAGERKLRRARDGIALVLVLVLLALVTTLAVESQILSRALLRRNDAAVSQSSLRRAAADAARAAIQRLADDPDLLADGPADPAFAPEETITPDGMATRTLVRDESARFDVNNLAARNAPTGRTPADILDDAFTLCGEFQVGGATLALADWVDADEEGLRESPSYRDRRPPYAVPNRPVLALSELLDVAGWKRSFFRHRPRDSSLDTFNADLADVVTVLPIARERPIPVNVNAAGRDALLAVLGVGRDDLVKTILVLRSAGLIRSLDPLLVASEPDYVAAVRPYLDVCSRHFVVEAQAQAGDRMAAVRALVVRDSSGRVEILNWVH